VILTKYGPVYLDDEEYERRLAQWMRRYYAFLGRSVFKRREKDFWDFHKTGLGNLGFPLNRVRLAKAAMRDLYVRFVYLLLHPGTGAHKVARFMGLTPAQRKARQ
jgi:hypothetical protein